MAPTGGGGDVVAMSESKHDDHSNLKDSCENPKSKEFKPQIISIHNQI